MVFLFIEATDSTCTSSDDGAEYVDAAAARRAAVRAASEIAMTDIVGGMPGSVVDARLVSADGATVDRVAVAMTVSSLVPG